MKNFNFIHQLINALPSHPTKFYIWLQHKSCLSFHPHPLPSMLKAVLRIYLCFFPYCQDHAQILLNLTWPSGPYLNSKVFSTGTTNTFKTPPASTLSRKCCFNSIELPGCIARKVPVPQLCLHFIFNYCHFCLFNKASFNFNIWQHNISLGVLWLEKPFASEDHPFPAFEAMLILCCLD